MELSRCQICGNNDWIPLPDPHPSRSVTTAGRIIDQPLGKSQCNVCGFVQRVRATFLGFTDYYENDYANYYERPGTEIFHRNRYKAMIDWMSGFLSPAIQLKKVLDIGCGQGWAIDAFSKIYPQVQIEGIEPSSYNVKKARDKGQTIYEGKLGEIDFNEKGYDLIFSNNVIQHVNDAELFLIESKKLLSDEGVIVITCPDGSRPNIEILWGDQNFSFLPHHLIALAGKMDFKYIFWAASSASPSLPPAQLLVLTNNLKYANLTTLESNQDVTIEKGHIFKLRCEYLNSFPKIDRYIIDETNDAKAIYNFGASYWTSVLAAYCPSYWSKVKGIVLDESSNIETFLRKKISVSKDLGSINKDTLVLGIAPASHKAVKERLQHDWNKIVNWDRFIRY